MATQRSARDARPPTREGSHAYHPLANEPGQVNSHDAYAKDTQERQLKALLERIEHSPTATRVIWFMLGLWSGGVISAVQ